MTITCYMCRKEIDHDDTHTCDFNGEVHDFCEDCCPVCNPPLPVKYYMLLTETI